MVVAIALAAAAVLAAVVVLAMGKGGELAEVHPDYPPLPLPTDRRLGAMDAALLQLPRGLWGYHVDATDEALRRLAYALTERDTKVAMLEQQMAELRKIVRLQDQEQGPAEHSWFAPPPETPWSPPDVLEYGPLPPPTWPAGHAAAQPRQAPQTPETQHETEPGR